MSKTLVDDRIFMERTLVLAERGKGTVSPNPMVGCVVVWNNKIVGEGWHMKWGEAHAEVNALSRIDPAIPLDECTVYVNLEPCSHHGKTPPCADMLVSKGVGRVVVAHHDPNPQVSGRGVDKLRDGGINVSEGILEEEAKYINRRYLTYVTEGRPFVILKWAQTGDQFIAREDHSSKWISNTQSRQIAHKWRAEEDAILVGRNTAHHDNPRLNVRSWTGKDPIRVVIDSHLSLDQSLHLFDREITTLCYNLVKNEKHDNLEFRKPDNGEEFIAWMLKDLHSRGISSLLVEGGSELLSSFVKNGYWDEARIFTSQERFGKGIAAPVIKKEPMDTMEVNGDVLEIITNESNG